MNDIISSKHTEDFVRASLEVCLMLEKTPVGDKFLFVDGMCKALPLLYLKASVMPEVGDGYGSELKRKVSEEMYGRIERHLDLLMGDDNLYLETFHPDIRLSDTPVAVKISESLADIWQDLGNFIGVFKDGVEETMHDSLALCLHDFRRYWGQKLVNVLRALHCVKYRSEQFS
jgi:hypothetical protein